MTRNLGIALLLAVTVQTPPDTFAQSLGEESLIVSPIEAVAGTFQAIHYTFVVGNREIRKGGGVRIEFPVAYGETEPYFWSKPQSDYPDAPGYVGAVTSRRLPVRIETGGIAGGIVAVLLQDGSLSPGDTLQITYKGIVQSLARDVVIRAESRRSGHDRWDPLVAQSHFRILPREAHTIISTIPSDVASGEPFDLAVVVIDRFGNLATGFRGRVLITSTDSHRSHPNEYTFTEQDGGIHVFSDTRFVDPGFRRIEAADPDGVLQVSSHYAWVSAEKPAVRRFFGDTHFHTGSGTMHRGFIGAESGGDINTLATEDFQALNSGGDHRGNFTDAATAYGYARDVVRLDFASSSEHDAILFDSLAWASSQEVSDRFNEQYRFTTFFAYEWTSGFMHHIVIYKDRGGAMFGRLQYPDLPSLWNALDERGSPALTIPHVTWTFDDHPIWDDVNNTYRRLGEVYSLWNNRFLVQPDDIPQRFETGVENKWSYQHAWDAGHRIGLVGATDNHLGRPGANNYTIYTHHTGGLAAVLAGENTRDALWDGLQNRRTYATTGTRIYLDFSADGHPMGTEYATADPPRLSVRVGGTNRLETVEIVRYRNASYETIHTVAPDDDQVVFEFVDTDFSGDCMYYVRVKQVAEYPGRPWSHSTQEMAWSSPIWITRR